MNETGPQIYYLADSTNALWYLGMCSDRPDTRFHHLILLTDFCVEGSAGTLLFRVALM